jgi:hypothetical protein
VLEDDTAWRRELIEFLDTIGVQTEPGSFERARGGLDEQLRHQRSAPLPDAGLNRTQYEIVEQLDTLQGAHLAWRAPDLGEEPGWVEDVLTIRRSFETIRRQQRLADERWVRARRWIHGLGLGRSRRGEPAVRPGPDPGPVLPTQAGRPAFQPRLQGEDVPQLVGQVAPAVEVLPPRTTYRLRIEEALAPQTRFGQQLLRPRP